MKKFWRILKKVMIAAGILSCAAVFVVVLTSAIKRQGTLTCSSLKVNIDYSSGLSFLSEKEIADRINYLSGGNIVGKPVAGIDFHTLENDMRKNPYVDQATIYINQQQEAVVDIIQKRPILRVINSDGVSYYISENNERMPVSDNFTSHVAIALGDVDKHRNAKRDSTVQAALYNLELYISKDEFLSAMIDQFYVHEDGQMDLIPKTGGHIIKFGNAGENIEQKFERLKTFYKEGLNRVGWTKYKTVNLEYDNQVVCEKADTTNIL